MSTIRECNKFNNKIVFISLNSFKQNPKIKKELNKYVDFLLNELTKKIYYLVCIGGESYLYGLCNKNIDKIFHYTNSKYIYDDLFYNNRFYKKYINNTLINYNTFKNIKNGTILIINLAKLHINLLENINSRYYKYIIIINCHHDNFWSRIRYLNNFKLIKRQQFVTNYNFITVNLFKYKHNKTYFVPLGLTCTVAYQLNNLGIRTKAYPFDWSKLTLNKLIQVLKNDFKDYNDLTIKKYSENHNSYLLTNKYNITFAHELYENNHNNLINLQKILLTRINRFKSLKNKQVIFIILQLDKNNKSLIELIKELKKYISNFKIIYITNQTCSFNNSNIIIINIDNNLIDWNDWKLDNINWYNIIFN